MRSSKQQKLDGNRTLELQLEEEEEEEEEEEDGAWLLQRDKWILLFVLSSGISEESGGVSVRHLKRDSYESWRSREKGGPRHFITELLCHKWQSCEVQRP
jgi:hypothetical protein